MRIKGDLGVAWRSVFTFLSFFFFGIGALILGAVVLPAIRLAHRDPDRARQACRAAVRRSFRLFIWFMRTTGVLDYRIDGDLQAPAGTLIIANHPSLIDVIFTIAWLPDAYCVVKETLSRNPFTRLIVRAAGYPISAEAEALIEQCARLLRSGARIIMFPEGTRTVPGRPLSFRRGAASVLCRARTPLTPVFLTITPPTLAKGERWFRAPPEKVFYRMAVGEQILPEALIDPGLSDRQNARRCTELLEKMYMDRLSNRMADRSGNSEQHGKSADGHQDPDREDPRAGGHRAVQHR